MSVKSPVTAAAAILALKSAMSPTTVAPQIVSAWLACPRTAASNTFSVKFAMVYGAGDEWLGLQG